MELLEKYDVMFGDHITYYARVCLDNGTIIDVKSTDGVLTNEAWLALCAETKEIPIMIESMPAESPIEHAFKEERDALKITTINYIKTNPDCTEDDLRAHVAPLANIINPERFLDSYIALNYSIGRITDNTFIAFRDWIYGSSIAYLMGL